MNKVRKFWESAELAPGTMVQTYLESRGITINLPTSLRYHSGLWHSPTNSTFPVMIGAIRGPDGELSGIHRTYLAADGRGKADHPQNKMMLGRCAGGAVHLAEAGVKLGVGEGIETMLSVQQATNLPCWAALSTSGLKSLILPSSVRKVIIFSDADDAGEEAARLAAKRFVRHGLTTRIVRPPSGMGDFNDVLADRRAEPGTW